MLLSGPMPTAFLDLWPLALGRAPPAPAGIALQWAGPVAWEEGLPAPRPVRLMELEHGRPCSETGWCTHLGLVQNECGLWVPKCGARTCRITGPPRPTGSEARGVWGWVPSVF